jgi:hypothetical protein
MTVPITINWVAGEGFVARDAAGLVGRGTSLRLAWEALHRASDEHYRPIREASAVWVPTQADLDARRAEAEAASSGGAGWQPSADYLEYWADVEAYRRQCDREAGIERADTPDAA